MAASSSDEARARSHAARFRLLRKLGPSDGDEWAAVESSPNGRSQLVVAERVVRANHDEDEVAEWTRDARRLATLEHANVARVRDVVARGEDVLVISDFVDGVRWSEAMRSERPPSLELSLRVLSDVLSGLSAIHNLRDEKRQPLGLVHGGLTPEAIVVGLDGVARVVGTHRIRTLVGGPGSRTNCYLAPELLLADDSADPRADIYAVGVMLWEALSGRMLFEDTVASAIVTQVLAGKVPRAAVPAEAGWAAPLADLVARALRGEAARRLGSAAAFGAELRRIAGPKLAPTVRVAGFVRATYGESVRSRRAALERAEPAPEAPGPAPGADAAQVRAPIEVEFDMEDHAPTIPPPPETPPTHRRPDQPPLPPPRSPATTMRGVAPPVPDVAPARPPAAVRTPAPTPAIPPIPAPARGAATALERPPTPATDPTPEPESLDLELVPASPTTPPPPRPVSSTPPTLRKPEATRNRIAGALIFGCAVALGAAAVWMFASFAPRRSPIKTNVAAPALEPAAPQPSVVTSQSSLVALPPSPPASQPSSVPQAPELPANSTPIASSEERPSAPSAAAASSERAAAPQGAAPAEDGASARAATSQAGSGESSGASRAAPQPPTRPASKKKYEPEGI